MKNKKKSTFQLALVFILTLLLAFGSTLIVFANENIGDAVEFQEDNEDGDEELTGETKLGEEGTEEDGSNEELEKESGLVEESFEAQKSKKETYKLEIRRDGANYWAKFDDIREDFKKGTRTFVFNKSNPTIQSWGAAPLVVTAKAGNPYQTDTISNIGESVTLLGFEIKLISFLDGVWTFEVTATNAPHGLSHFEFQYVPPVTPPPPPPPTTGTLVVTKVVVGTPEGTPNFEITLEPIPGASPSIVHPISVGPNSFTVPVGTYRLTESQTGGASVSYSGEIDEEGIIVITAGGTTTVIITNTFETPQPPTGTLEVTKVVVGTPEGTPNFEITLEKIVDNEELIPLEESKPIVHTISVGLNTFDQLPVGRYRLTETQTGGATSVSYSGEIDEGIIVITADGTITVTITNTFPTPPPPTGTLVVTKVVVGTPEGTPTYQITLVNVEDPEDVINHYILVGSNRITEIPVGTYRLTESLTGGASVSYSGEIDAGIIVITADGTTTVTITNTFPTPPPPPPLPPVTPPVTPPGEELIIELEDETIPLAVPDVVIEVEDEEELVILEEAIPLAVPDVEVEEEEEMVILDEEVPLGIGELPKTGESSPIAFYLFGILLTLAGLMLRKESY